ncbi:unnamed protein product [Symbiodinium necroappetens]|uniref:Uncharacterized protein n=1 Tax=Symbiodinium necroappetens TaxID=1628268 RepID=A0A813B1W3_9DINO|nr:unnamed protein product [Symbiodinium necroappetens]
MKEMSPFLPVKDFVAARATCGQAAESTAFKELVKLHRPDVLQRKFRSGLHNDDLGRPMTPKQRLAVRRARGPPKSAEQLLADQGWLRGPVVRRFGLWGDWGIGFEYTYELTGSWLDGWQESWDALSHEIAERDREQRRFVESVISALW